MTTRENDVSRKWCGLDRDYSTRRNYQCTPSNSSPFYIYSENTKLLRPFYSFLTRSGSGTYGILIFCTSITHLYRRVAYRIWFSHHRNVYSVTSIRPRAVYYNCTTRKPPCDTVDGKMGRGSRYKCTSDEYYKRIWNRDSFGSRL